MSHALRVVKPLLCASALLAVTLAGATAAAEDHPNVQPGSWQTTVTMEMPGMPAGIPPRTSTHCLKADQVKDNYSFADAMQSHGKDKCKVEDLKLDGGKLTYRFTCEDGTNGSTELVFGGDSYEGTTKATVAGHGQPMTMIQHLKAKRVGDC